MSGDYLYDRDGDDAELAALEAQLGGFAHRAPLRALPARKPRRGRGWIAAGAALAVAAAVIAAVALRRDDDRRGCGAAGLGFAFQVTGDGARCGGVATARGTLPVGAWLETPAGATARVEIADIGAVTLGADSRLRLVETGATQHRLELTRGRLSATVSAPPRLFVVDTPAATAVDLGCAYDLVVEDDGRTRLVVTHGAVSLEGQGRTAYVPVGLEVRTVPGRGPGTPVMSGAPAALVAAVDRYDRSNAAADLAGLLAIAEERDAMTVWNLLANAAPADRAALMAKLDELVARPEWVLDDDVLAGKPQALDDWRTSLAGTWSVP